MRFWVITFLDPPGRSFTCIDGLPGLQVLEGLMSKKRDLFGTGRFTRPGVFQLWNMFQSQTGLV